MWSRLQHLSNFIVGLSGLIYGFYRYLAEKPASEFGNAVHPLEELWRVAHLISAPVLVFAIGFLWTNHVSEQLAIPKAKRRKSGLLLIGNAAPMIFSGYLIQTAVNETLRNAWIVIHLVSAGIWLSSYLLHLRKPLKRRIKKKFQSFRTASQVDSF